VLILRLDAKYGNVGAALGYRSESQRLNVDTVSGKALRVLSERSDCMASEHACGKHEGSKSERKFNNALNNIIVCAVSHCHHVYG